MLKDLQKKSGEEDFEYSGIIDDAKTEEIITRINERKSFDTIQLDGVEISDENFLKILTNLNLHDHLLNYICIKDLKNALAVEVIREINRLLKNFSGNKISLINCGIDFSILAPI